MIELFKDQHPSCMITRSLGEPVNNAIKYLETKGVKLNKREVFYLFDFFCHASKIVPDYDEGVASCERYTISGKRFYQTIFCIENYYEIKREKLVSKDAVANAFIKFKEYYCKFGKPFSEDILNTVLSHFNQTYNTIADIMFGLFNIIEEDFNDFNRELSSYTGIYSSTVKDDNSSLMNSIEFDVHKSKDKYNITIVNTIYM